MTKKRIDTVQDKQNGGHKGRIPLIAGLISLTVAIVGYVVLSFYYQDHFAWNTKINGIAVENMTLDQAKEAINEQVDTYFLTLEERNDNSEAIIGEAIGLHTVFGMELDQYMEDQNGFAWPLYLLKGQNLDIDTSIAYEEAQLKEQVERLECLDPTKAVAPVDAHVSAYGENGYEVIPEEPGNIVIKDTLYAAVKEAIENLEHTISLEDANCYQEPNIYKDEPGLLDAVDKMNQIAQARITYQFGDKTEILDGKRMDGWFVLKDGFVVELNPDKVKEFVDYIGKTYNSFGRVRTFMTTYGKEVTIRGGDYGWWLNRGEEVKELTQMILEGKKEERKPAYFQTAQQYGEDDIGDTYVEINLTAQHLYFYKKGELVMESDFVSGNLAKKYGTPVGTYPLQYKESDAVLVGEDYASPVRYWMPFNGNIGLHDAPWRDAFGKDIYLTNGSHGCINMPPKAAKKMFQEIERGVAIVVYKLKGTENYETEPKKDIQKTVKN